MYANVKITYIITFDIYGNRAAGHSYVNLLSIEDEQGEEGRPERTNEVPFYRFSALIF